MKKLLSILTVSTLTASIPTPLMAMAPSSRNINLNLLPEKIAKEQKAKYRKEYYEKNKEKITAKNKEYKQKNKEKITAKNKEYNEKKKLKYEEQKQREEKTLFLFK